MHNNEVCSNAHGLLMSNSMHAPALEPRSHPSRSTPHDPAPCSVIFINNANKHFKIESCNPLQPPQMLCVRSQTASPCAQGGTCSCNHDIQGLQRIGQTFEVECSIICYPPKPPTAYTHACLKGSDRSRAQSNPVKRRASFSFSSDIQ